MNTHLESFGRSRWAVLLQSVSLLAATLGLGQAFAGQTDISPSPLTSTTSAQVKPNIMLLMDTSESMSRSHMPDEVEDAGGAPRDGNGVRTVGYKAGQCNVTYYNRNQTYLIPKKPDGSPFPTPSFNSAPYAGYASYYVAPDLQDQSSVDLRSGFVPYESKTLRAQPTVAATPQAAFYYAYTGTQILKFGDAPCTDTDNLSGNASKGATGGGTWFRVVVGANTGPGATDERTNFAIWYSYYRTRMSLTKSAASLAFTPLTDTFRVGFITVKPKDTPTSSSINPSKYLAIDDFNSTQRNSWFNKLFSQAPDGSSPAREGLARVGRHYAGQTDGINTGMTGDPVQYSCQQNFTIMTTDGYWNTLAETANAGAVGTDGLTLTKSQDSDVTNPLSPKPIWDGGITSVRTTRDASNFFYDDDCTGTALLKRTSQKLASTKQFKSSSTQTQQTTQQYTTSTSQALQSTQEYATSTVQTNRTRQQYTQSTLTYFQGTTQFLASTTQRQKVTLQDKTSTRQIYSATLQYLKATSQTKKTTLQYSSTTSQISQSTYQRSQSTVQYKLGQTQAMRRQIQVLSYDGLTERDTPVATCTAGGNISCSTREVTPLSPVASCTAGSSNAPDYIVTQCSTNTVSAPTPVASCTPGTTTGSAPSYTVSTCTMTSTAAALVSTCTPGTSNSGSPNYIQSTCTNTPITTNVFVASCTNGNTGAPNYVTTACSTNSPPAAPSAPCTSSPGTAPNYIATVCTKTINTVGVPVPSSPVCSNQTANSGNSWIDVSCATSSTPATAGNSVCSAGTTNDAAFNYTTCTVNTISASAPIPATSCTNGFGAGPNFYYTQCSPTTATTPAGVSSCSPGVSVGPSPGYVQTTCTRTNNAIFLSNATACTPVVPTSGNGYLTVNCNTVPPTPMTPVPVNSCTVGVTTNGAPNWVYTTCTQVTTPPAAVGTCVPGATNSGPPNYIATNCTTTATTAVGVLTCTPGETVGPGPAFVHAICAYSNTTAPVAATPACTNQTAAPGNQFVTIGCSTVSTASTPGPACTPGTTVNGSFLYTTCTRTDVSTNVPVASCTQSTGGAPNYTVTTCPSPINTPAAGVASCTPGTVVGAGPGFVKTTCALTSNPVYVADASACTPQAPTGANGYTTVSCATSTVPAAFVASCTPGFSSTGAPNYNNTTCVEVPGDPPTPAPTCAAGTSAGPAFITTICTDGPATGPTATLVCNSGNSGGPEYITTTCATGPAPGKKRLFTSTITSLIANLSGSEVVGTPQPGSPITITAQETDNVCYVVGLTTPPPLPAQNPYRPGPAESPLASASAASCASWPCSTSTTTSAGGSLNSLADVAQYYYATDLRPSMKNDVLGSGKGPEDDSANWQHMTTFTIALGVSGTLNYQTDYRKATTTSDFADIRTGAKGWPIWPDPNTDYGNADNWNNARSIDDYWHTAVNGRGQYFSAGNPTSVIAGLSGALSGIADRVAAGSAASASSLQPTAGDNFAFVASYVTGKWTGDVRAELIDLVTGAIGIFTTDPVTLEVKADPPVWSAQKRLDDDVRGFCDNRRIYLLRQGATDNKVNFSWDTQACNGAGAPTGSQDTGLNSAEKSNFTGLNVSLLSQYPSMTDGSSGSVDQRSAASGAALVNFLRGQTGNEAFESNAANKLYRSREHALGDIVGGQPVYVKGPFADYADTGYQAFKSSNGGRTPMVYVAANDGMLHAFFAGTSPTDPDGGKEAWAIVPSAMLPNLYKLADENYKKIHRFFVDGTPTVADAYDSGAAAWKTVLVGGYNAGGKGYYAVDVTSPTAPKGLWEFNWSNVCYDGSPATAGSDCNIGFTFGKPLISKLSSGTWVVMFTSGYNNVSSPAAAGDGVGYLYVLNAFTGKIMHKISTGAGDATTPSGLAQINNFVDNTVVNNTTVRVYGGDNLGNVWRFDVNNNLPPAGYEATLVGTAKDPSGNPEPITVRPELAEVQGKPMVFISTGRLLGTTDIPDKQVQSIYGIIDPLTGSPAYPNLRSVLKPLRMTQQGSGTDVYRTIECSAATAAGCGTTNGWVVNLPDEGERVNVDMELVLGTLIVSSNVPGGDVCASGGYGWINYLNFRTGDALTSSPNGSVSSKYGDGLIVGSKTLQLENKKFKTEIRLSNGSNKVGNPPIDPPLPTGNRVSWREIVQ